jgi:hypothetical protein
MQFGTKITKLPAEFRDTTLKAGPESARGLGNYAELKG